MQTITLRVNERSLDHVMWLLNSLPKQEVEILSDAIVLEGIKPDDSDFGFIEEARKRRKEGESTVTLQTAMDELNA